MQSTWTHPWLAMLLVAVASASLLGLVSLCAPLRTGGEAPRKLLHVGLGTLILLWPWMFDRAWPPLLLAAGYVAALAGRTWCAPLDFRLARVMGVDRPSRGEFWFPIAVAALFVLARGNRLLFCIPVATMTFADSAAALVGRRYGQHPYPAPGGTKSLEGSAAFFISAFFVAHVPMLLHGHVSGPQALGISLAAAATGTLLEALASRGIDNLLVPVGVFGVLRSLAG